MAFKSKITIEMATMEAEVGAEAWPDSLRR